MIRGESLKNKGEYINKQNKDWEEENQEGYLFLNFFNRDIIDI